MYKTMFELIKKTFIGLLTGIVSTSNLLKWVSLSNQKCMAQVLEVVNTLNELSNKVYVPKPKRVYHDYRNKLFENINRAYIMQM